MVFFAGLWEPTGEGTDTCCAILTEPVSPAFAFIHDRQPVVLDHESRWQWLDPDRLTASRVSTRFNRPANDDPGLLEPIDDPDGSEKTGS